MGEDHLSYLRERIESQYRDNPTGAGGSFGEILCWEIHSNGLTFIWLAEKWGVSLPTLGELIWDHCKRLEGLPHVDHAYRVGQAGPSSAPLAALSTPTKEEP